ncbi:rhodanese-like domain-containing protein [Microbacterium sp. Marseille-Q6965]|uniref:rhodanese-like domain-containing protein n=1 Tax=Microbacterium sp. Marseille-Q6965 TaxID=2965072 RepID=UPI0021B70B71|nr:rhodanese-like domain-containing protein [Microbacterium sp. Marseille-Q6965]
MTAAADIAAHYRAKLAFETDPADVRAAQKAGRRFALVDTRSAEAWAQGRARGAIHLPPREIPARATAEIPAGTPVVVYCWSPGCNGGDKAALAFAELGYEVKLMIGGFEYWAREGYPVVTDEGETRHPVDPLTGVRR